MITNCPISFWIGFHHDLDVIVQKSNHAESNGHKQHRNDLRIIPDIEQGRNDDAGKNYQTAHRRGSLLFQMRLRPIIAHLLSEFQPVEKRYHDRAQH